MLKKSMPSEKQRNIIVRILQDKRRHIQCIAFPFTHEPEGHILDRLTFTFPPMPPISVVVESPFIPSKSAKSFGTTVLSAPESTRPMTFIACPNLFLTTMGMKGACRNVPSFLGTWPYR